MKRLILIIVLFAIGCFNIGHAHADTWDGTAAIWTHGSGTESDPYLIESAANLAYLAQSVNDGTSTYSGEYFMMTTDIDLDNLSWAGIGTNENVSFQGTFDGNEHSISGINTTTAPFNFIKNATIRNLSTNGSASQSGIVARAYGDTVIINNCHSAVSVIGNDVAGILNQSNSTVTIILNCSNSGTVKSASGCAGGIVARSSAECNILQCHNTGWVDSYKSTGEATVVTAEAGGIITKPSDNTVVSKCYNVGMVKAISNNGCGYASGNSGSNAYAGGIIGASTTCSVTNCFNRGCIVALGLKSVNGDGSGYAAGIGIGSTNSNCYNTGTIVAHGGSNKRGIGGSCTNCYYLDVCDGSGVGTTKSETEMRSIDMPTLLNVSDEIFIVDNEPYINDGYPIFKDNIESDYNLIVTSNNVAWGSTSQACVDLNIVRVNAMSECGYVFSQWNDGNTENPRVVTLSQDTSFTAVFEPIPADTVIVHDTITNIVHDTATVTEIQKDTIYLPQYIYDTVTNNIHDTTYVTNVLNDTIYLPQYIYDTVTNIVHDTVLNTVYDTLVQTLYDTTFVTHVQNDTVYLPQYIYDTVTNNVHDTTYITNVLNDTVYLPQYIYDTVTSNIHDTTYVTNVLNDTVYLPQYIYDTVINTVHDTVLNTVYDTLVQTLYDTTFVTHVQNDTVYLPQYIYDTVTNNVHDTTYITNMLNDTVFLPQYIYDTVTNTLHDTVWNTIYDTIYIHDTVYITETGIHELKVVTAKIYTQAGKIIVEDAGENAVYFFDSIGRILATRRSEEGRIEFTVPSMGVYMVKVGESAVKKVVVR